MNGSTPTNLARDPDAGEASSIRPLLLAGSILAAGLILWFTPLRDSLTLMHVEGLRERLEGFGALTPLVFVLLTSVSVAIGAPRLAFAVLGGVLFGWIEGVLLAELGMLIGCWGTFSYARWLGRDYVLKRLGNRFTRLRSLLERVGRHGILANILIRTAPVGNCLVVNLFMSISKISMRDFLIGTAIGTLPETVIYALFGSSAAGQTAQRLMMGASLLLLLTVFSIFVARTLKRQHHSDSASGGA